MDKETTSMQMTPDLGETALAAAPVRAEATETSEMPTEWAENESTAPTSVQIAEFCWLCGQAPCKCRNSDIPIDWSATIQEVEAGVDQISAHELAVCYIHVCKKVSVVGVIMVLSLCGMMLTTVIQLARWKPVTRMHMIVYYLIVFGFLQEHYLCATLSQIYYETLGKVAFRLDTLVRSDLGEFMLQPYRPIQALFHQIIVFRARRAVRHEPYVGRNYLYVTKIKQVIDMVDILANLPTDRPWIGFDLEANNLGPYSNLSLLQIRDYLHGVNYLVDLLVLQEGAWTAPGADGTINLRKIFEDPDRKKLIFDCRQDSACLYAKAGIKLAGVIDCQWMHMLTMKDAPEVRPGLISTVSKLGGLDEDALKQWKDIKNSERSHGTWERRPIPPHAKAYAAGDVELLRAIHDRAEIMLTQRAMRLVRQASLYEIKRTQVEARKYYTVGRYTYDFVHDFWKKRLRKPGVQPTPNPVRQDPPFILKCRSIITIIYKICPRARTRYIYARAVFARGLPSRDTQSKKDLRRSPNR